MKRARKLDYPAFGARVDYARIRFHGRVGLELNAARRFYECLGGKVIGQQQIERAGQTFIEVAYGGASLNVFS